MSHTACIVDSRALKFFTLFTNKTYKCVCFSFNKDSKINLMFNDVA